ncbi:MAG: hypothetical protein RJA47_56 [Actinomycetota bacterium]|jgi:limonene-1,2-epoxide hydrolase
MASDPDELVRTFISLLSARDLDAALVLVSPDCEYDNVPMGRTHGPEGIRAALTGFFAMAEDIEWETLRQVASGDLAHGTVLNERDDRLRLSGSWRSLPVCGVFEVRNGVITLWRDYFDRETLMKAMAPGAAS